jgi:hypothetical protein
MGKLTMVVGICVVSALGSGTARAGDHKKRVVVGYVPVTYGSAPVVASPYAVAAAPGTYAAAAPSYAAAPAGAVYYGYGSAPATATQVVATQPGYAPATTAAGATAAAPYSYYYPGSGTSVGNAPVSPMAGSRLNNNTSLMTDIYHDLKDAYPEIKSSNAERTERRKALRDKAREKYVDAIKSVKNEEDVTLNDAEEHEIGQMVDAIMKGTDGDSQTTSPAPVPAAVQPAVAAYPAYYVPTMVAPVQYVVPVTVKHGHHHKLSY